MSWELPVRNYPGELVDSLVTPNQDQFKLYTKKQPGKSPVADLCQTPPYALDPLTPYLNREWVIWESACGEQTLANGLWGKGFSGIVATDILTGDDFFSFQPDRWDMQLTNPPYSLKLRWLERSYNLDRPFALLLPVQILGVGKAQTMFKKWGVEVILLSRRVGFRTINTSFENSSAWFSTCWITWGLGIGQQLTFADLDKKKGSS